MISSEEILKLWTNPDFSGSFRGIRTFKVLLKTDLNIDVPEKRLYSILRKNPVYLIHQKVARNFDRRHYDVRFYGELVQADIAYMFNFEGFKYFILLIDCFSSKIFVEPLKNKDSNTVTTALKKIFQNFGAPIVEFQSDQGKEFQGTAKQLFKDQKILFRLKYGKNKANFAESAILRVKRKLYMMLRSQLNQNWTDYIAKVVESFNNTPIKKLGWLAPSVINSKLDSLKVSDARKSHNIEVFKEPNFKDQLSNQKNQTSKFKLNDYVYLTFNEKLFDKSYDVQVIYISFESGANSEKALCSLCWTGS
jgi:hypothetical protein